MKQYLLMVNENAVPMFQALCPGIEYVQVEGLKTEDGNYALLAKPMVPPPTQMPLAEDVPVFNE